MSDPFNPKVPAGAYDALLADVLPQAREQRLWEPADGPLPSLFVSHGAPPTLDDADWLRDLYTWGQSMPKPRGIVIVSAHWENAPLAISASAAGTELYYDFGGFHPRYYELKYRSPTRAPGPSGGRQPGRHRAPAPVRRPWPRPRRVHSDDGHVPGRRRAGDPAQHAQHEPGGPAEAGRAAALPAPGGHPGDRLGLHDAQLRGVPAPRTDRAQPGFRHLGGGRDGPRRRGRLVDYRAKLPARRSPTPRPTTSCPCCSLSAQRRPRARASRPLSAAW